MSRLLRMKRIATTDRITALVILMAHMFKQRRRVLGKGKGRTVGGKVKVA